MKKVCIVVPVYKQNLNMFEKISLKQLLCVLGKYPICLVQPDTIEIEYEELLEYDYNIYKYDEWYFQNTATYSELMLSPFFYEKFIEYEYMLVYQLDCFVFKDILIDFCNMGYDYIGAPQYHAWTKEVVVGNGGFSLRKISAVLNMTSKYEEIVTDLYYKEYFRSWEDNFFSYCGRKNEVDFSVPDIPLANTFSVVLDIDKGIQNIPVNGLPFGIHAWHRMNFDFWKDIIKAYGYKTDYLVAEKNVNTLEIDQNNRYRKYFFDNFSKIPKDIKREFLDILGLHKDEKYILWGAGHFGKIILNVLLELELDISMIVDSNPREDFLYGISVKYPDFQNIREQKLTVLISSEIYEDEIESELLNNNCEKFIKLAKLFEKKWKILRDKSQRYFPRIEGVTVPFQFIVDNSWISDILLNRNVHNIR